MVLSDPWILNGIYFCLIYLSLRIINVLITLFCLPSLIFGKFASVFRHAFLIIVSTVPYISCWYAVYIAWCWLKPVLYTSAEHVEGQAVANHWCSQRPLRQDQLFVFLQNIYGSSANLQPVILSSFYLHCICTRECWTNYRGPDLLAVIWFGSSPPPSPVSKLSLFLSLPVCRRSSLLMGDGGGGGRMGWGRSQIIWRRESLDF